MLWLQTIIKRIKKLIYGAKGTIVYFYIFFIVRLILIPICPEKNEGEELGIHKPLIVSVNVNNDP